MHELSAKAGGVSNLLSVPQTHKEHFEILSSLSLESQICLTGTFSAT